MPLPSEPNWLITALIGAVLGVLITPASRILLYPTRRLKPHSLSGRWFEYYYSFHNGKPVLRYGIFTIRTGLRHPHVVERESSAGPADAEQKFREPSLRYRGRLLPAESGHTVIALKAASHEETLLYRFLGRIPSNSDVVPGVWAAYDHDLNPAAGAAIICRTQLDVDAAEKLLQSWAAVDARGVLRMHRSPSVDDTRATARSRKPNPTEGSN